MSEFDFTSAFDWWSIRKMSQFSSVGKRVQRVDAFDKASGLGRYTTDLKVPRMLYAKILRSPYPHARIISIDTSKAEKLSGVRAVMTHKDVPEHRYSPAGIPAPMDKLTKPWDMRIIEDVMRFIGDRAAAVAADDLATAEEAVELIDVNYEQLSTVYDPEVAMKEGAPALHPYISNRNIATFDGEPYVFEQGDVERGFKESDFVLEDRYATSRQAHICMEPNACIASYDAYSGRLTVTATTQIPFQARTRLAWALGIPAGQVKVIVPFYGGGFGGRQELHEAVPIASVLSMRTKRPVKLVYTREEEFVCSRTRHPMVVDIKTGVKKDGLLVALKGRVVANTGAYASHGPLNSLFATDILRCKYKVPNYYVEGYAVYTNCPIAGAYRGYGNESAHWAWECQMDAIAEKLGLDPIAIRMKNHYLAGDTWPVANSKIESCGLADCFELGAKKIGWARRTDPAYRGDGTKRKGIGTSCVIHVSGCKGLYSEHTSAFIKVVEDGTVQVITGVVDGGQGSWTILGQIVAEEMGVPFESVRVLSYPTVDTDSCPFDVGIYGSRTTFTAGGAVKRAAAEAKKQIIELAAKKLEASIDDLDIKDGRVFVKGTSEKGVTVKEVALSANYAFDNALSIMGKASYEPPGNAPPFGAHFAEVEVDVETGRVTILNFVAAHDVGRAINPNHVEGQIQGAALHGFGYAMSEDLIVDTETGKTLNANFLDYKMFTAEDFPKMGEVIVESIEPTGPFGAKGVGELAMVPTAAAIANAVYNAVGVRIRTLPITAEKVLQALREKKNN